MVLFSLIAALLIEQIRPLPDRWAVDIPLARLGRFLEAYLNAGEHHQGFIAWLAGVGGLVLVAGGVYAGLYAINPLLAWLWNVAILYLTLGFRQFSHYYTDIHLALRMDDLPHARELLAAWQGRSAATLSASDVARQAIEEALIASHRHVFGVLVCFVLLPGPCGAVLYRAAAYFSGVWGRRKDADVGRFGAFSRQAFALIDWFPARATAAGFAIVGNFEDAVYSWRNRPEKRSGQTFDGADESDQGLGDIGIVLSSAAGALGVRLDGAPPEVGTEADVDFMQSAVGLVWRALLLWLLLLLLLGFGGLLA